MHDSFVYLYLVSFSCISILAVLLTLDGRVKICDMGLAKGSKNATMTGAVGTVVYMAPEVFGGEAEVDVEESGTDDASVTLSAQDDGTDVEDSIGSADSANTSVGKWRDPRVSDVYALGVMLWQLWHRDVPFFGLGHHQIMKLIEIIQMMMIQDPS